jgi:cell division protein FtsB
VENGNVLRYRVDKLEHRLKGAEQATKWVADKGAKANEQIRVHDRCLTDIEKDVDELKQAVAEVPVLKAELSDLKDSWRAVRNAFYAAGVGLFSLAATIFYQATS